MSESVHATVTRKSLHHYMFTSKHHGGGGPGDACWFPAVSRDEEFAIFDQADFYSICDERGWLYGILRDAEGELRDLGTWQQQLAEFQEATSGMPWHGYPIWAVNQEAPPNRSGQKMRPSKEVFAKMEREGLITSQQRKRLYKGSHA